MRKLQPECDAAFRATLAASVRESDGSRFLHRLHVVLLVSLGHSCYQVANWFAEDPSSVERWVHAYETQGCAGLCPHPCGGRPGRRTAAQHEELTRWLAQAPSAQGYAQLRWSGKLLARHLDRRWGLHFSVRHCQRLLGQARRRPETPDRQPATA